MAPLKMPGIKIGDIITMVENNKITSVSESQEQVSKYRPGKCKINVTVAREQKEIVVPVTLTNINNSTEVVKRRWPLTSVNSLGAVFEEV